MVTGYEVINAFENGETSKSGNYESDGKSLFLFGNEIANHRENGLYVSLAGWNSPTTRKALSYLTGVQVSSRQGNIKLTSQCDNGLINPQDWYLVKMYKDTF